MTDRLRRRWLVAGIVSAVLNVFLIGFFAGRHVLGPGGCGARGFSHGPHGEFRGRLGDSERGRLGERMGRMRQARDQVREALVAEPYQAARLEAALNELRQRSLELQLDTHQLLLQRASRLSQPERKRLADSRLLRRPADLQP